MAIDGLPYETFPGAVIDKHGAQCNCFQGNAYIDAQGNCACMLPGGMITAQAPATIPKTHRIVYLRNQQGQPLPLPMPAPGAAQTTPLAPFDIGAWIRDNKLIVGGIVAAIVLILLMRGGGFTSREVTSVTRYGK